MSNSLIDREITQGVIPIGTPKAYKYDAALVEAAKASVQQGMNQLHTDGNSIISQANTILAAIRNQGGYPLKAATASAMTDTTKIYVYTGSETGYTFGDWYYHNGTAWTDGGVYNAMAFNTDPTLTVPGAAADAKVTGDKITKLDAYVQDLAYIAYPKFTKGKVITWVDSSHAWTYSDYAPSASVLEADMFHLDAHDKIVASDYTGITYTVYWKIDGTETYKRKASLTTAFEASDAGDYAINTNYVPSTTLTDDSFRALAERFTIIRNKNNKINGNRLVDNTTRKEKTDFIKPSPNNLINKMTVKEGYVVSATGVVTANAGYAITDKMYLEKNTLYSGRNLFRVCFYDEHDTFLQQKDSLSSFTTPANFSYAIFALSLSSIYHKEWQLVKGGTLPSYAEQHLIIDGYRLYDTPDVVIDPIAQIKAWDKIVVDTAPIYLRASDTSALSDSDKSVSAIYGYYDALMNENPEYITKTTLGDDGNGTTLYRYDFKTPEFSNGTEGQTLSSKRKTKMILISGVHPEYAGIYSLYHALERITNDPLLADIKSQMHFIIMPVVNAYAVNGNAARKNHNGIDLARNFEVGFVSGDDPTSETYSGTTALSEVEDQYVDAIMSANTDAIYFASCHNFQRAEVGGVTKPNFNMWGCSATMYWCNVAAKIIDKLTSAWKTKYSYLDSSFGSSEISAPLGSEGMQAMKYGIQGGTFEVSCYFNAAENDVVNSASAISRGSEVYINMIRTAMHCFDYRDKVHQFE